MEKLKYHRWFGNFNWNRLVSRQLKAPYVPIISNDFDGDSITNKSMQEFVYEIEGLQAFILRKGSMIEPEDWDEEF